MSQQYSNTSAAHWNSMTYHSNNPEEKGRPSHMDNSNPINYWNTYYPVAVKLTDGKVTTLLTLQNKQKYSEVFQNEY